MAAKVLLWQAFLALGNYRKALDVVNTIMIPQSKSVYGKVFMESTNLIYSGRSNLSRA